ncbi:unnamed protein product [Danaus chrysippus]|uniref:(African queen) hypothetical protein n=1 Tax=Danaus chrysippus TaxID=151541 RepID=A0A8J2QT98_9NEOP|nr:unnamed protein product [Danaus chrysippus]
MIPKYHDVLSLHPLLCLGECDEGTHAYTIGCGYLEPEPTCEDPHPSIDQGILICDFMACYCDSPTVRNKLIGKCVPLDECPQ